MNGNSGHMITLNIHIPRDKIFHSIQFDVQLLISDICHHIQEHLPITIDHDRKKNNLNFQNFFFFFF
jgi:hypothetical protein